LKISARFRRRRDRGFEPMFITVVKPHYRLDTGGRFHLVTRKGEFVFAGAFLRGLAARREAREAGCPDQAEAGHGDIEQDRIAEKAGFEAAIQGLRDTLERKSSKNKMRRVLRLLNGAGAVGA
jgi:hypothetical protein